MNGQTIIEGKVKLLPKLFQTPQFTDQLVASTLSVAVGKERLHSGLLVSLLPPGKVVLSMWCRLNRKNGSINNSLGKVTAPKGVLQVAQYIFFDSAVGGF